MIKHISPSWFVRNARIYRKWCDVSVCKECGTRAKYEDMHPNNPCPECGGGVVKRTGRWIVIIEPLLMGFLRKEVGEWELLNKD